MFSNFGELLEEIKDRYDENKYIRLYENVVVAKGGDGTLLRAINLYRHFQKPFYGINAGTVGFLMNSPRKEFEIEDSTIVEFKSIKVEVTYSKEVRDMASVNETKEIQVSEIFQAFNEVMVGGDMNSWIDFDVTEKDEIFSKFKGGGLIISTPQGSTGINKNNGGVILPLSSNLWSITGDKTNRNIEYVIPPRDMFIKAKSRTPITLWVDGSNHVVQGVSEIKVSEGDPVRLIFTDYDEFKIKRRL